MKKILMAGAAFAAMAFTGAANAQEIKFGVVGPLTGPLAAFGKQLTDGVEQAVEDFNKAGGINGSKIVLLRGDDAHEPKQGVSVANKFVGDGVKFVVGPFSSGITIPVSEVLAENGIMQVSPSATNPKVTERGLWNTFRTCGRDDQQGDVAGKYLAANYKGKKIAVAHDKTTYGQGLADETRKALAKAGIKEVLYEGVTAGEKDYSALVTKLKTAGADVVFWGGLHTEGGLIIRQMRDQGLKTVMMSGDGITSDEFATIGGAGVEGTLMTFPPDPRKRPEAQAIVAAYKAKNINPEAYTLYSYAAMQVIKQAAEAVKSLDPKKVAEQVKSGQKFNTVIGELSFDKKGDITRPDYVVYTWKKGADGKITYIQN